MAVDTLAPSVNWQLVAMAKIVTPSVEKRKYVGTRKNKFDNIMTERMMIHEM